MSALRDAIGFLTIVRARGTSPPAPSPGAVAWFPAVGAALGLCVAASVHLGGRVLAPIVAAVIAVGVDAWLTRALHLDGLADSADGLLPPVDEARRLQIMAAPDVGAFGAVALVLALLARTATLALAPATLVIAALWATSRAIAALAVLTVPYARPGGLATAFREGASRVPRLVAGAAVAGAAGVAAVVDLRGGLGVVAAVVVGFVVVHHARRRIGGFTGDVLGAAIVCAETAGLVVATSI